MSTDVKHVLLIGAGGHAKVVYETLRCIFPQLFIEVRDDDLSLMGQIFYDTRIENPSFPTVTDATNVHVAIGCNATRKRISEYFLDRGYSLFSAVHPAASVSRQAKIADGVLVAAQSVVGPDTVIDEGAIINHGAVVDHDCKIGPWAHIAPNSTLSGDVRVHEGVLVGAGAIVLPGVEIEKWATVGAGAVVTRNVTARSVVVGVPARAQK